MKNLKTKFLFLRLTFGILLSISALAANAAHAEEACPIKVTLESDIAAPADQIFAFTVANENLSKIMIGYGPLPAVKGTKLLVTPFEQIGGRRQVNLSDNSIAFEEITALDPPTHFAYRVWGYTNSMANLALEAHGEWWFEPRGTDTHITWQYTFTPKSALSKPVLRMIVNVFFRGYMQRGLDQIKAQVEQNSEMQTASLDREDAL